MDKYGKDLIQLGKQRMQSEQDQITNIEYPEHPIETTENLVESLNEEVQEQIIPTPTPQLNDEQIESYARTHDLSEQDISINPDSVNESIDQYLHVGKFRSTAPVTPMV